MTKQTLQEQELIKKPYPNKKLKGFRIDEQLLSKFEEKIQNRYGPFKVNKALEALVDRFVNDKIDVKFLETDLTKYFNNPNVLKKKTTNQIVNDVMRIVQKAKLKAN